MKLRLVLLLLVIAKSSLAAPPDGFSSWKFSFCETPDLQEREQCARFSTEVTVLYNEGQICGWISESWFDKSPSAGFFSNNFHEGAVVKFADSFQESEQDFGWATLKFSGTEAEWKVLKSPRGGLVGDASALRRVHEPVGTKLHNPTSCAELKKLGHAPFPRE